MAHCRAALAKDSHSSSVTSARRGCEDKTGRSSPERAGRTGAGGRTVAADCAAAAAGGAWSDCWEEEVVVLV